MSIDVSQDKLYTQQELYTLLRVSRSTFTREKTAGRVPKSIIIMGRTLYPSSEVNLFIKSMYPELWIDQQNNLNDDALKIAKIGQV